MDPAIVAAGVKNRLADVDAVVERRAAFVFGSGDGSTGQAPARRPAARDFVLRTLGTAADAVNYRLLTELHASDAGFAEICNHLGLGEAAAWERTNDLVQAGLVARAADQDRIGLTATGVELVEFVEATAAAAEVDADQGS